MRQTLADCSQILLYGDKKFVDDFAYAFNEYAHKYHIIYADEQPFLPVTPSSLETEKQIIILCSFNKNAAQSKILEYGLVSGKHYYFADDLFYLLDFDWLEAAKGRNIAVWATGVDCDFFEEWNQDFLGNISFYIDLDKSKVSRHGKKIIHPDTIDNWQSLFIIVATTKYFEAVRALLIEKGLSEHKDFENFNRTVYVDKKKPSEMLATTVFDPPQKNAPMCYRPFKGQLLVMRGGMCCICCSAWLKPGYAIGDLKNEFPEEVWNSKRLHIFRLSVINRTLSFCNLSLCKQQFAMPGHLPEPALSPLPQALGLAFDYSCNLCCSTCRPKAQKLSPYHQAALPTITRRITNSSWFGNKSLRLTVADDGEVFYSKSYLDIIFNKNRHSNLFILSNGILLTEYMLSSLKEYYENISISISVDAACKKTYESIRRGGHWDTLMQNLSHIAKAREEGFIRYFELTYVVQDANALEMGDFVDLGKSLNVDTIRFRSLHPVEGVMAHEDYLQLSEFDIDGLPKENLAKALRDERLANPMIEMYSNIHNAYTQLKNV